MDVGDVTVLRPALGDKSDNHVNRAGMTRGNRDPNISWVFMFPTLCTAPAPTMQLKGVLFPCWNPLPLVGTRFAVATDRLGSLESEKEGLVLEDQIARLPFWPVLVKESRCLANNLVSQGVRLLIHRPVSLVSRHDRPAVG